MISQRQSNLFLNAWFNTSSNSTHHASVLQDSRLMATDNYNASGSTILLYGTTYMFLNYAHTKVFYPSYNTTLNFTYSRIVKPIVVNTTTINAARINNIYNYICDTGAGTNLYKIKTRDDNIYYVGRGAIFDVDLKPLFITGISYILKNGQSILEIKDVQREVFINSSVFRNKDGMLEKYIITTLLPFLSSYKATNEELVLYTESSSYYNKYGNIDNKPTFAHIKPDIKIDINDIPIILSAPISPTIDTTDASILIDSNNISLSTLRFLRV